jgi:hypothetical protein
MKCPHCKRSILDEEALMMIPEAAVLRKSASILVLVDGVKRNPGIRKRCAVLGDSAAGQGRRSGAKEFDL